MQGKTCYPYPLLNEIAPLLSPASDHHLILRIIIIINLKPREFLVPQARRTRRESSQASVKRKGFKQNIVDLFVPTSNHITSRLANYIKFLADRKMKNKHAARRSSCSPMTFLQ